MQCPLEDTKRNLCFSFVLLFDCLFIKSFIEEEFRNAKKKRGVPSKKVQNTPVFLQAPDVDLNQHL